MYTCIVELHRPIEYILVGDINFVRNIKPMQVQKHSIGATFYSI